MSDHASSGNPEKPPAPEGPVVDLGYSPAASASRACVWCGNNLWGIKAQDHCSECGAPVELSLLGVIREEQLRESANPVEKDVPCVRCGTSLCGRRIHQLCDSCSSPVAFSVPVIRLWFCASHWIKRVRAGITLWLCMILVSFLMGLGLGGISAVISLNNPNDLSKVMQTSMLGGSVIGIVVGAMNVLVVWLVTSPNPTLPSYSDPRVLRNILRGCCFIGLLSAMGSLVIWSLNLPMQAYVLISLCGLPSLIATVGMFHYLRSFAIRLFNRKLYRQTRIVVWGYCVSIVVMQVMGTVQMAIGDPEMMMGSRTTPSSGMMVYSCFMGVFGLASLGFTVWLFILLYMYRSHLGQALAVARSISNHSIPSGPP